MLPGTMEKSKRGSLNQCFCNILLISCLTTRAVPNRGSVLFGRIRIVELWISVIVTGYIIVNIIIIILSGSSLSFISRPMYKSENTKTTLKLKMKSVFRPTSETSLQFHIKFALRKTKHSRFSASKQVRLSSAMSPAEMLTRHAYCRGWQVTSSGVTEKRKPGRIVMPKGEWIWSSQLAWCSLVLGQLSFDLVSERWDIGQLPLLMMCMHVVPWRPEVHVRI